jgi:MoaA/NifB/PqqE/SkfB family radical SAM enzyme/SAM-dependent methyltransferase
MGFDRGRWERLVFEGMPVYVRADRPLWFVPNKSGDDILRRLAGHADASHDLAVQRFLERLPDDGPKGYRGRADLLTTEHLREFWFHITNRCDSACSHCLFAARPDDPAELPVETILAAADEAVRLGCRIFALTGGEPFIHPGFPDIVEGLLAYPEVRAAVLTNGMNLRAILKNRSWDPDRFHLQVSLDGLQDNHDRIRGKGAFERVASEAAWLKSEGIPYTLSMCVQRQNLTDMPGLVNFAAAAGAGNVHFMWYFIRGRGRPEGFALPDQIFDQLTEAAERAAALGIHIDNIEALKTQIFAPAGTIHDGSTSGWESLAMGPGGKLYPSAALVGIAPLATDVPGSLADAWRESPVLEKVRRSTAASLKSPLRFLLGGGDLDHCYIHGGRFIGCDPYMPLYEKTALWLICREASGRPAEGPPRLRLKMGDILESCGAHGSVALVHANCLVAMARQDSLAAVKTYYTDAVRDTRHDILNPVFYADDMMTHIPEEFRFRGYGCGSPVLDASIETGEHVVDLGSGTGVECFIAARLAGPAGRVTGVDMLDPMLEIAKRGAAKIAGNLGYENLTFRKGYLEALPLDDGSADVVLSNCVMNLSPDKRRSFGEIFRILRAGGRMVISDVVCETEPDASIRNDDVLRGECIAGALTQKDLLGMLDETGFGSVRLIKRYPYRTVRGHPFFSLTLEAVKPSPMERIRVLYRGPFASVVTSGGTLLTPGLPGDMSRHEAEKLGDQVFILDDRGAAADAPGGLSCCCAPPPDERAAASDAGCCSEPAPSGTALENPAKNAESVPEKQRAGCMVCGAPLTYLDEERDLTCHYCGKRFSTGAVCGKDHFVCDGCHQEDGLKVIERICLETNQTDMLALLSEIRTHPAIPVHGPEHHAMVPGIILAAYRNLGGAVTSTMIRTGLRRGSTVAGGSCGFMGVCGAAAGVGIAFSLIIGSNPLNPGARRIVQTATQQVLAEIGALEASRCCQRDAWIALKKAAELSRTLLPVSLIADAAMACEQQDRNRECIRVDCPLYK